MSPRAAKDAEKEEPSKEKRKDEEPKKEKAKKEEPRKRRHPLG